MAEPVTRTYLSNGLLVLLKEIHTAELISHWVWYRVGSRNEVPGKTGASHWVEHMQFKGTELFPAGILDKAISREGGFWNAYTNLDWTTYYETMPASKIDLALRLEADRMGSSLFDPEEVASERTVIISERQGDENEPTFRLDEEVQAAAFRVHPYHHMVIGDSADLASMGREALFQHYLSYYAPNNAVLAVAGDFESGEMLSRIRELYEPLPAREIPPPLQRLEPAQNGERRVSVEGPGETTYLHVAYHAPAANDPDFLAVTVLDSLLNGASSLNIFGGGLSNKTSRLYRSLVETELAVSIYGGVHATIDPYLYNIIAIPRPDRGVEEVLAAIDGEIDKISNTAPSDQEVQRAVKQARALFAYSSETISNQAFWLGFAEMFASYDWFTSYLDRLAMVTPQDVQRVAQTYLRRQNRVVGVYQPTGGEAEWPAGEPTGGEMAASDWEAEA